MYLKEDFFTMEDGIRLYTRIVVPDINKKYPIVFIRNPYEEKRDNTPYPIEKYENNKFIKNGYAVIVQHARGRGSSEGECKPYQECADGLNSLEIIRSLPFYNGEIYVTGRSYLATVHLCYLGTQPKDIKAAALSIQTDRMYFRNYRNGCCYDFCNIKWWLGMLKRRYPYQKNLEESICRPYYKIMERIVGEDVKEYTNMLLNDEYNDFWKNDPRTNVIENLNIPVLFTEGWYDFYIDGMFSMWDRLPDDVKLKSAFVVGPWGHATAVNDKAEYPLENGNLSEDYIVNFFNSIRDNKEYTDLSLGKVNYYSIGGDFWTTDTEQTQDFKLYFNSDNTLLKQIQVKGEQSYIYDPDIKNDYFKYHNIYKAKEKGENDCILSFLSEPFEQDTHFYGKIRWNMNVKSDCEDTAFFMRVYFVEDEIAYNLTETITSLSHINKEYKSGEKCFIDILTPPIAFTMKKGNSIRVDISSYSGIYVPHSNTKQHWAKATESKIAHNTVICDEYGCVVLPILKSE